MQSSWQLEAEAPAGRGRGIAARRFRLSNGLGLITAIDRRAPIVALQTWYRVGSRHERPGATGMAHLFEHLMFGQTESLPPGEFDRLVERTGGESNAATWVDWTYYRLSLPTRDLALGIRLEAERMQHLV
ncbi:MAG: insulinase family protein, partial [Kofleriaceae bacterium]